MIIFLTLLLFTLLVLSYLRSSLHQDMDKTQGGISNKPCLHGERRSLTKGTRGKRKISAGGERVQIITGRKHRIHNKGFFHHTLHHPPHHPPPPHPPLPHPVFLSLSQTYSPSQEDAFSVVKSNLLSGMETEWLVPQLGCALTTNQHYLQPFTL